MVGCWLLVARTDRARAIFRPQLDGFPKGRPQTDPALLRLSRSLPLIRHALPLSLRVRERRVLSLFVEVAALVVPRELRADVLVAGALGGLRLVPEAVVKRLCDLAME